MTLPASFPLSVSQIQTEYGLTLPVSLRAFIGQPGYPSSGPISMSDFLGKSATAALSVFISGAPSGSRSGTGSVTTSAATASATGGVPGYTYAWTYVSGTAFTIDSPASATTTFTQTVTAGSTINAVYRCTVTDSALNTASSTAAVAATASVIPALAFSVPPSDVSSVRSGGGSLTSSVSAGVASGGTAPYSYAWTYVSGDVFTINSPSSNSTTFTTTLIAGQTKTGVYRLTVTDSVAATVSATVTIELEAL